MGSRIQKLRKEAEELGIDLDANETISDLEAKITLHKSTFKVDKNEAILPAPNGECLLSVEASKEVRRQPVKHINFTTRLEREAKKNG